MKIYNNKVFASGVFEIALGLLSLIADIMKQDFSIKSSVLIAVLVVLGFGSILRSVSPRMAKEDKLEELDERNRLITLKSKSKSFQLTQIIAILQITAHNQRHENNLYNPTHESGQMLLEWVYLKYRCQVCAVFF